MSDYAYGVYSYSYGDASNVGVFGAADRNGGAANAINYGVWGQAKEGANNYAVYGYVPANTGTNSYAGFFAGPLYSTVTPLSGSDARLKRDVETLSGADVLARLLRVPAHRYRFRVGEAGMPAGLDARVHVGVIAQELEREFPELVREVQAPVSAEAAGRAGVMAAPSSLPAAYKAVAYTEMIPLLLAAMQEQQAQIAAQAQQIAALRAALAVAGIRVGQ